MKMSRMFNGQRYGFQGTHVTKSKATAHVADIKKKGGKARKVPTKSGWSVYAK